MSKHRKQENEEADQNLSAHDGTETTSVKADEAPISAEGSASEPEKKQADDAAAFATDKTAAQLAERDARIKALEEELSTLKDQYLRKLADYENFRKRMFREKDDAVQFANSQLLTDLVDVLDNFDRAVQSSETSREFQSLHDGVDMIRKHFLSLLENKYGLVRFDSLNQAFDPNMHEAMMSEQGDCPDPLVIEEYSKGYKLKERILRTSKVKVRMPTAQS